MFAPSFSWFELFFITSVFEFKVSIPFFSSLEPLKSVEVPWLKLFAPVDKVLEPLSNLFNPLCSSGELFTSWLIPVVTCVDTPCNVFNDVFKSFNPDTTCFVSSSIALL